MNAEILAPMVVAVVLIVVSAGVLLLRPLVTRLAPLLEALTREKLEGRSGHDLDALRTSMEMLHRRLDMLEERQSFTDALLSSPERKKLPVKNTDTSDSSGS